MMSHSSVVANVHILSETLPCRSWHAFDRDFYISYSVRWWSLHYGGCEHEPAHCVLPVFVSGGGVTVGRNVVGAYMGYRFYVERARVENCEVDLDRKLKSGLWFYRNFMVLCSFLISLWWWTFIVIYGFSLNFMKFLIGFVANNLWSIGCYSPTTCIQWTKKVLVPFNISWNYIVFLSTDCRAPRRHSLTRDRVSKPPRKRIKPQFAPFYRTWPARRISPSGHWNSSVELEDW